MQVLPLLLTLLGDTGAGADVAGACPRVPHLVLDVELGDDHVLRGTTEWTYTNVEATPLTEVQFGLLANAEEEPNPELSNLARAQGFFNAWEPAQTELSEVRVAGAAAEWTYVPGKPVMQTYSLGRMYAAVHLPQPLAPGACVAITAAFSTTVPHRIGDGGHYNGDTTHRFGWFPEPRYRKDGEWSDGFVLMGFTHVTRFRAPADQEVILGAERLRREDGAFFARSDVPVRSVPFVASSRLHKHSRKIDGVKVNVYTYSDAAIFDTSDGEADEKLDQIARMLPFYRKQFGAFRYETLQVVESPLSNVGMAADGLILLGDLTFIYDRSWIAWGLFGPVSELTLAHELGHQWWGIGVGSDFDPENWISESFAQQMMLTYSAARFGVDGVDYLSPNWFIRWLMANLVGVPLPTNMLNHQIQPSYTDHLRFGIDGKVVGPVREREHAEETMYLVYQKGYLAVRGLQALLGPSGLVATMRAVYEAKAGDVITTDDLRAAALDVTGVDIGPYFDTFVRGLGRADLSVTSVVSTPNDDGFHTIVTLHRDGDVALPAKVRVVDTGEEESEQVWDTRQETAELAFDTKEPVRSVTVDPEEWVPDPNRANNHWPERKRFELFAPQRNPDATTFSLNPLPIHRRYVAGVSFGGVDYEGNRFWTGLGLSQVGIDSKNQKHPYYAVEGKLYGELAMPTGRAAQLSALAEAAFRRDRDNGNRSTGKLSVAHTLALYEQTDIGEAGTWSLPRTTLTTELGVGGVVIPGRATEWTDRHVTNSDTIHEGAVPLLKLTILRDESLNLGAAFEVSLAGGTDRSFTKGYGVSEAAATYAAVIPYLGQLSLLAHGYVGTDNLDPLFGRPGLRALPYSFKDGINPYDLVLDGGAALKVPLLRDLRVKNELTLGLLVFNDVFFELHYGAARGSAWARRGHRLGGYEDLGEAGVALGLGFGFLTVPINVSLGVGVPTWPSSTDLAARGFFFQIGT